MPAYELPITIETADHIIEDGAVATIVCDEEVYTREPYSWGGGRGSATICNSARIQSVRLGGLILSRDDLVKWITEPMVELQESYALDTINTMLEAA